MATEQQLLEQFLQTQDATLQRAFRTFITDIKSETAFRLVRIQLEQGNVEGALRIADNYIVRFGTAIPETFKSAGKTAMKVLTDQLGGAAVGVVFNPASPAAAALAAANRLEFITNITQQVRDLIRPLLVDALTTGQGPIAAARLFRDAIGLTKEQWNAVENYKRLLEQGSRAALDRALHDRRFTRTFNSAEAREEPLTQQQIDRMVEAYRKRALALRAETIARTETTRALGQAQFEATEQLTTKLGIDPNSIIRVWNATMDKRTRDTHREMDGQERGMNVPFDSTSGAKLMFPGDPSAPASEVINCRCVLTTRIKLKGRSK